MFEYARDLYSLLALCFKPSRFFLKGTNIHVRRGQWNVRPLTIILHLHYMSFRLIKQFATANSLFILLCFQRENGKQNPFRFFIIIHSNMEFCLRMAEIHFGIAVTHFIIIAPEKETFQGMRLPISVQWLPEIKQHNIFDKSSLILWCINGTHLDPDLNKNISFPLWFITWYLQKKVVSPYGVSP